VGFYDEFDDREDREMFERIAAELSDEVVTAMARLVPLDEATVSHRPAPDRWTVKEVIGHLIDSAANNHQRFVRGQFVAAEGVLVLPKYDQNAWVRVQQYADAPWNELIALWASYNRHLARVIRVLPARAQSVRCKIGDDEPMTLGFIVEDYLAHLRHHLTKIWERIA
jgi:hypothetical protein